MFNIRTVSAKINEDSVVIVKGIYTSFCRAAFSYSAVQPPFDIIGLHYETSVGVSLGKEACSLLVMQVPSKFGSNLIKILSLSTISLYVYTQRKPN